MREKQFRVLDGRLVTGHVSRDGRFVDVREAKVMAIIRETAPKDPGVPTMHPEHWWFDVVSSEAHCVQTGKTVWVTLLPPWAVDRNEYGGVIQHHHQPMSVQGLLEDTPFTATATVTVYPCMRSLEDEDDHVRRHREQIELYARERDQKFGLLEKALRDHFVDGVGSLTNTERGKARRRKPNNALIALFEQYDSGVDVRRYTGYSEQTALYKLYTRVAEAVVKAVETYDNPSEATVQERKMKAAKAYSMRVVPVAPRQRAKKKRLETAADAIEQTDA